jgi:UDP-N-acetyl-D-mannosaminuronate dehydrogenase
MRVGVIGTGQFGLVTAVTLADVGHDVCALDVDAETIGRSVGAKRPSTNRVSRSGSSSRSRRGDCRLNANRRRRTIISTIPSTRSGSGRSGR